MNKVKQVLQKLLGFDDVELDLPVRSTSTLIDLKTSKAENKQLKAIVKQQGKILKELSDDNIQLGRDRRRLVDTVITQRKLIEIYEEQAKNKQGDNYETKTA